MLPADSIMRAAERWLRVLRKSTFVQAWSLIRSDANYADLTQTQYSAALEWLGSLGLVVGGGNGVQLSPAVRTLGKPQRNQLLFELSLERAAPAWLPDADLLIPDESEIPRDAAALAHTLGLTDRNALLAIRCAHGRVDLAQRTRVGAAGERALCRLLEAHWPGSTTHVAETDDGFGYDIAFRHAGTEWYVEVKSTSRRGRLVVYLSRHEHEVGLLEPNWRMVIVGLDDQLELQALATVRHAEVLARAPHDIFIQSAWQSASHQLAPSDLQRGLAFLDSADRQKPEQLICSGARQPTPAFAWMP
jgi:hypothetical protein